MFCDALGPHGSPTSDSERTMVTPATRQVLAVIISFGGPSGLETAARRMGELFVQYAAGHNAEFSVV